MTIERPKSGEADTSWVELAEKGYVEEEVLPEDLRSRAEAPQVPLEEEITQSQEALDQVRERLAQQAEPTLEQWRDTIRPTPEVRLNPEDTSLLEAINVRPSKYDADNVRYKYAERLAAGEAPQRVLSDAIYDEGKQTEEQSRKIMPRAMAVGALGVATGTGAGFAAGASGATFMGFSGTVAVGLSAAAWSIPVIGGAALIAGGAGYVGYRAYRALKQGGHVKAFAQRFGYRPKTY